jgi:hypothetical protein
MGQDHSRFKEILWLLNATVLHLLNHEFFPDRIMRIHLSLFRWSECIEVDLFVPLVLFEKIMDAGLPGAMLGDERLGLSQGQHKTEENDAAVQGLPPFGEVRNAIYCSTKNVTAGGSW